MFALRYQRVNPLSTSLALRPVGAASRSFYTSAPVVAFPPESEIHRRYPKHKGAQAFRGLDMNKIHRHRMVWDFYSKKAYKPGYTMQEYNNPTHKTLTIEELVEYYTLHDWYKKFTIGEMIKAALDSSWYSAFFLVWVVITLAPIYGVVFSEQAKEPMEIHMDRDEFFADYWWNYYGHYYDHHKYSAWLEKRRAAKWRGYEMEPRTPLQGPPAESHH